MATFRKRKDHVFFSSSDPLIREVVREPQLVNGVEVQKEVIVLRTQKEYAEAHPCPKDEFSIGQQLRAGVPLKEVPCSTLLDSPDNLDYDVNDIAEQKVLDELEKDPDEKDPENN